MMQARGKEVVFLKRLSIGPLKLDETLGPGDWRELTEDEIYSLNHFDSM
jgi:16S rRNA pseudouridine516 synthase